MSLIPKRIENIVNGLFDSAKKLVDAVAYLHEDLEDFKKRLGIFSDAITGLRGDLQSFRGDLAGLQKAVEKNTEAQPTKSTGLGPK